MWQIKYLDNKSSQVIWIYDPRICNISSGIIYPPYLERRIKTIRDDSMHDVKFEKQLLHDYGIRRDTTTNSPVNVFNIEKNETINVR